MTTAAVLVWCVQFLAQLTGLHLLHDGRFRGVRADVQQRQQAVPIVFGVARLQPLRRQRNQPVTQAQ